MRLRARHYASSEIVDITLDAARIASITPPTSTPPDLEAGWVAPAFFDLQINGAHGISFNSPKLTLDQIRRVTHVCHSHGIAQFFPTLITGPFEALRHGFATLAQARRDDPALARALPGYHLEGPYISPVDGPRGAHPLPHVRRPHWEEFQRWQDAADGHIRLVTLAPEIEGAIPFIRRLAAAGVTVAIGHTAAGRDDIRAAVDAGARLSTHLGNGCHATLPRHDNYIWEQLAADDLFASLIADGQHLPASLLKCFTRIKTPARLILTCDAGSLAGLPPGKYADWNQEFEIVPPGKIVVPGTSFLGGSWDFTDKCVSHFLASAEVTLSEAFAAAAATPRSLTGLSPQSLAPGHPADLILFDWQSGQPLQLRRVLVNGHQAAG